MNWGHPYGSDDPLPVGAGYYQSSVMDGTGLLSDGGIFSGALVKDIYVLSIVPEPTSYALAFVGLASGGVVVWWRQRA